MYIYFFTIHSCIKDLQTLLIILNHLNKTMAYKYIYIIFGNSGKPKLSGVHLITHLIYISSTNYIREDKKERRAVLHSKVSLVQGL